MILIISILIALWSGSRAVYAVQKALRAVDGGEETRGYVRTRALGVGVTVAAGFGVLVAYLFLVAGEKIWSAVSDALGVGGATFVQFALVTVAILWVWALLFVIYRWGPPIPVERAGAVSAIVAALLVIGSVVASSIVPAEPTSLSVFGTLGVVLIWLYYVGIVIVAAPTLVVGLVHAFRASTAR